MEYSSDGFIDASAMLDNFGEWLVSALLDMLPIKAPEALLDFRKINHGRIMEDILFLFKKMPCCKAL